MILRAAWSCFLVRKVPLVDKASSPSTPDKPFDLHTGHLPITRLLDFGVVVCAAAAAAAWALFEPLIFLVAAVVLLDEHSRPPTLLEALLLIVRAKLGLDQDGRLGHLLVEGVLGRRGQGKNMLARSPFSCLNMWRI